MCEPHPFAARGRINGVQLHGISYVALLYKDSAVERHCARGNLKPFGAKNQDKYLYQFCVSPFEVKKIEKSGF